MSAATKRAFAKEWFARGECPGCGAPLAKVAGSAHEFHFLDSQDVNRAGTRLGYRKPGTANTFYTRAGDPASGVKRPRTDPRVCRWTADDLTSLVLIATDFGRCEEVERDLLGA